MNRVMLKSKVHRATVTDADLNYVGSLTIDPDLLEAADIREFEQVAVVDVDNGARLETYTIAGERGSGAMKVNGAAARLVHTGDTVIVISYAHYDREDLESYAPRVVHVDRANRIISIDEPVAPLLAGQEACLPRTPDLPARRTDTSASRAGTTGKVTLTKLQEMRALGEPIVMVTAYDHPSAKLAEAAGVDVVLVGDSAANNVLGYADTVPITVEELLMLTAAVRRGLSTPMLVGDLPFGSYEASDAQAIATAHRFVKEGGCDVVKLEGGGASAERARAIVRAGVPVMGHVGLTPQTATALGGYRAQGRTAGRAKQILDDALALQAAGCFALVFEAIPAGVTDVIMEHVDVPVIGIGAGPATDGQVLVLHDLLGIQDDFLPKFARRFADVKAEMLRGLSGYAEAVRTRSFPGEEHTYGIAPEEIDRLKASLRARPASVGA